MIALAMVVSAQFVGQIQDAVSFEFGPGTVLGPGTAIRYTPCLFTRAHVGLDGVAGMLVECQPDGRAAQIIVPLVGR